MGPRFVMLTQARLDRNRALAVLNAAPPPVPVGDSIDQLVADVFNANNAVLAYASAVSQTNLPGLPRPEDFYEDFVNGFTSLKTRALVWQNSIASRIVEIPMTIVSYNTLFLLQIGQINDSIDLLMDDPTNKEVRASLANALTRLSNRVALQQASLQELRQDIKAYAANLTQDAAILRKAAADSVAAAGNARSQIEAITRDIDMLRAEVRNYQAMVRPAAIGAGISFAVLVFGVFLSFAYAPLGVVVFGLGLVGAGAGTVIAVRASNKVKELNARIETRTSQLTTEGQQATVLVGITQTVNNLIALSERASTSIDAILDGWKKLQDEIDTVVRDLANAQRDLSRDRLQALKDDIEDATDDWREAVELARKFSGFSYTIDRTVTPIPPPTPQRAA